VYCDLGEFKCNSGECIHQIHVCNGYRNCIDGSDEYNCWFGWKEEPFWRSTLRKGWKEEEPFRRSTLRKGQMQLKDFWDMIASCNTVRVKEKKQDKQMPWSPFVPGIPNEIMSPLEADISHAPRNIGKTFNVLSTRKTESCHDWSTECEDKKSRSYCETPLAKELCAKTCDKCKYGK
ncbi:unnamed protein product, partial [Meganyctiphanes norvegica]